MPPKPTPILYLDLDGTVRHGKEQLGRFVNKATDVVIFPEAVTLMLQWKSAGGRIVGVTNQGGIALGLVEPADVIDAINATQIGCHGLFDKIMFCRHHPDATDPVLARCWCRKPLPGMLIQAAVLMEIGTKHEETYPPHLAVMVGDRPEDEGAAKAGNVTFRWAEEWRASARRTVYCTYCHKEHSVLPTEQPCAPDAWQEPS